MTTVAVLGATSGIAHATLRLWAQRGYDLRLVARDPERLQRVAADLTARGAGSVTSEVVDLADLDGVSAATAWAFADGPVDIVLIAFGIMPSQEEAAADLTVAERLLTVTGTLNLLAAQDVVRRMLDQSSGSLVVLGSVAGDRGRQSNYLYGASKAMVATGVAGLQHRAAQTPVSITLVKPGPTATAMTEHLQGGPMKLASADSVAADIVKATDESTPVIYTPRKWQLIMAVVRALPRAVFHRTKL